MKVVSDDEPLSACQFRSALSHKMSLHEKPKKKKNLDELTLLNFIGYLSLLKVKITNNHVKSSTFDTM